MRKYFLYSITCLVNNKVYIGVTIDCYTRFCHHRGDLRNNVHDNRFLQKDYNDFGAKKFVYDIISEFDNRIDGLRAEKHITECILCLDKTVCYNIVGGGAGLGFGVGYKTHRKEVSNETRIRMAESNKLRPKETQETKNKRISSLRGGNCYAAKKVIDVKTGKVYPCLKDTLIDHSINYSTLRTWLNGVRPNKSNYKWHH